MDFTGIAPGNMGRIPPEMQHLVLRRSEWTHCTMEHSLLGPIHAADPGAPFHHIALALGSVPARMGIDADGRRSVANGAKDCVTMIEAGVAGVSWWDDPFEAACLYFTSDALSAALGDSDASHHHGIRTTASHHAPLVHRLLHGLLADGAGGQMHGKMVGDAIFIALAAALTPRDRPWRARTRPGTNDWRARRALEYIHAHLVDPLDVAAIAAAVGTSPFHLSRQFTGAMGMSIWRYVLRERARYAVVLIQNSALSLLEISNAAGFDTYASFIAAVRHEFGTVPSRLRAVRDG